MNSLIVDQVCAKYHDDTAKSGWVLENITLQIKHDEFLVIFGPSGCGKTTLLNLLAGFTKPDSGRIELNGVQVLEPGAERGVISQQDALLPWLNVIEKCRVWLAIARY
jgi:taurine transport system ATP-binding protein